MSGQESRRKTLVGRLAIGLLGLAVSVLLAPAAAAQPENDANAAITAAWDASGGDGGTLGPRQGDVYPVGEGFAQNFTSGKIFFTPATGAHIMQGAILEKYESLGGPADSDLGFPTIDEGPGRAPGSRNTTFSARDKPVIFWTPGTGARVVRGAINAAWDKIGGSTGPLGVPAEDEAFRGDVVTQKFTGGELSYNTADKSFTTVPPGLAGQLADLEVPDDPQLAINRAQRAAGGPLGPLGAEEGPSYPIGQDGLGQNFTGGKIFYTPDTGATVVTGQVLEKYESVGGPEGELGFPTTSEVDGGLATESRMTSFAGEGKPAIFWTPDYGAVIVRGAMKAAWDKLGGAKGELGAPMADQTEDGAVITQRFSGGVVSWDSSTNSFTTEPANLASELSGLQVPGQNVPEQPAEPPPSDSNGEKWFHWSWWWLLAIVPALILIGLVAFATLRNRGSRDDDGDFGVNDDALDDGRFDDGFGNREAAAPAFGAVSAREPAVIGDDYPAAMFGDRYAGEGLDSLSSPTAGQATVAPPPASPWEAPPRIDDDAAPAAEEAVEVEEGEEDPDDVDTAPTRVPTAADRDPLTDTGRHARIEVDEPEPSGPAFRLSVDGSDDPPEGYPIKADTKSGRYWPPDSAEYDDAQAEIWFASEEFARTNGFVRGD